LIISAQPIPFASVPLPERIGKEWVLDLSLFNCVGFSDVGLADVGKSNTGGRDYMTLKNPS